MVRQSLKILAILTLSAAVTACARPYLDESSALVEAPGLTLTKDYAVTRVQGLKPSDHLLRLSAAEYEKNGGGSYYAVIAYSENDSASHSKARRAARILKSDLARHGVMDTYVTTMPVSADKECYTVMGFARFALQAPAECQGQVMPGFGGATDIRGVEYPNYRMGCTVRTAMASQISRPLDARGRSGVGGPTDGNAVSNQIDAVYRSGETQEALPSYIISELAGN